MKENPLQANTDYKAPLPSSIIAIITLIVTWLRKKCPKCLCNTWGKEWIKPDCSAASLAGSLWKAKKYYTKLYALWDLYAQSLGMMKWLSISICRAFIDCWSFRWWKHFISMLNIFITQTAEARNQNLSFHVLLAEVQHQICLLVALTWRCHPQ